MTREMKTQILADSPDIRGSKKIRQIRVYPRLKYMLSASLVIATAVFAIVPGDLRENDPLSSALYHAEPFQGQSAIVPNPPLTAQEKLQTLVQSDPTNAQTHKALADIEIDLLDLDAAESQMMLYVEKSQDKDKAYSDLEFFYHSRLRFEEELKAMAAHAGILQASDSDVIYHRGPYQIYHLILDLIQKYRLPENPHTYYEAIIHLYPKSQEAYLEYIAYLRTNNEQQSALPVLEMFKSAFPDAETIYLQTRASLLTSPEAFTLMNQNYSPVWSLELVRALDQSLVDTGKKREYLNGLKEQLKTNPLDFNSVTRLFYAFYLSGNLQEAQNALNDFRLLKEKQVIGNSGSWNASDLYVLARLNHLILNYNEAARYYYALYTHLRSKPGDASNNLQTDGALFGFFQILTAADERPVQFGAGNLDYYKDIGRMDQNPGILNGILSFILNGSQPETEFNAQEDKAVGYSNRAQAFRIILFTQKNFPNSKYLPAMYRDALGIFERYGQNQLVVQSGQEFFKNYPDSPEILEVAVKVADAYARLNDHKNEWATYDFILPVAAKGTKGPLLEASVQKDSAASQDITYQFLLSRYIASLTQQKNYTEVVKLYRSQIAQYPNEETLYESFSQYLSQNQLLQDEEQVYRQAIERFQDKGWYEKLARWYLRKQREQEYEVVSKQIIDLFSGTDVQAYLLDSPSGNPYENLYLALNQYANQRFPTNIAFVKNILAHYSSNEMWSDWESLAARYYFIDPDIRNEYLQYRAGNGTLPTTAAAENAIDQKLAGDVQAWQSHFEDALPYYEKLTVAYTSDPVLNLQVADLKRSLGVENTQYYFASAKIREHLGQINPSEASYWTTAGETLADIEQYDLAKQQWQKILAIDPYNPERYLEVATILWDYYLFDDALATIQKIRNIKEEPALFAYEAGAIQESKRDYNNAIAEYAKSLIEPSDLARNRLSVLYQRKSLRPSIQKYLDQKLAENPENTKWWIGIVQFYTSENQKATVKALIKNALVELKEEPFREISSQLIDTSQQLGFDDLQESLLQRRIAIALTDSDRLNSRLELARFYESHEMKAKAENAYKQLYQEQPRSAGIINELLAYDWRMEQYSDAFAVYKQVLQVANADFRKKYLLEYAKRCLERKDYTNALTATQDLLQTDPLNATYFQLASEIYAEQKDFAGLTAHYKQGLQAVQQSKLSEDQKNKLIADFRRGIIRADLILKDYSAALDQYIEIINRDSESTSTLMEVGEFASQHEIFDRLLEYYRKTAEASPKDHRWPMVLGRLFVFSGQYNSAVTEFQKAIAIHPERTDFYQQLAECYQRLGDYKQAIQTYEILYERTYKSKQWLGPLAELYARIGEKQKALELYSQTLERQSPMQQDFLLCTQALQWGEAAKASEYGKAALDKYFLDMSQQLESGGLASYAEAHVRNGAEVDVFLELVQLLNKIEKATKQATFDAEVLRSAEYITKDAITNVYPSLLKTYLTAERFEAVDAALFSELQRSGFNQNKDRVRTVYLPMVRAAAMAPAEERLLTELTNLYFKASIKDGLDSKSYSTYRSTRDELRTFYSDRFAFKKLGTWLELQLRNLPVKWNNVQDLPDIASAYRLAENNEKELAILREYYQLGVKPDVQLQPDPVERYLSLLSSLNLNAELKQAAQNANLISANYFIKAKNPDLAFLAIQSLSARLSKEPVWRTMNQGMIGWQFRQPNEPFDLDFRTSLDLRSIGEQLVQASDSSKSVLGNDWFYYGSKYGEYLWWTDRKGESIFFLNSDLEGAPTNPQPQNRLYEFYSSEKDTAAALQHAELELQLDPTNVSFLNDRAQALAELGRNEEAVLLWRSMISKDSQPGVLAHELVLSAADAYGFLDSVKPDFISFLSEQIETSGIAQISILLSDFLNQLPEAEQMSLLNRWIPSAPAPKDFGSELLATKTIRDKTRIVVYQLVGNYLASWMQTAAGQELEQVRNEWINWNQQYVFELMNAKEYDQALRVLAETIQRSALDKKDTDTLQPSTWELLELQKALILIRAGRKEAAMTDLNELLGTITSLSTEQSLNEDRFQRVYSLLKSEGLDSEAQDVLQDMYERLLSSGQTQSANYLGLAEVLVEKGQLDAAQSFLSKMIYLNGENLEGMESAAALMEKYQHFSEAIGYRTELEERISWNYQNKAILAEDLLASGKPSDAAVPAAAVLKSDLSTAEDRVRSAKVYGTAVASLLGPIEMREIETVVRVKPLTIPPAATQPYQQRFRSVLLQILDPSPLSLLTAQVFLDPESETVQVQLFQAYRRNNNWELALKVLDPSNERENEYYAAEQDNASERSFLPGISFAQNEEDYDYSYQTVEKLNLDETQTRDLALQMAECSGKLGDLHGELYFLNMALHHTTETAAQKELQARIEEADTALSEEQTLEAARFKVAQNLGRQE